MTGKTGIGKSSLINGVIGKEVAKEGDSLDRETVTVRAYAFKYHEVDITIWDSPGLQDGFDKEKEYIMDMLSKGCANSDLVLYCAKMTDTRFRKEDHDAIRKLTIGLGRDIWKNAIFVMTFANDVRARRERGQKLTPDEERKQNLTFFKQRIEEWRAKHVGAVIEAGVDAKVAESIPIVPAGYDQEQALPDRDNWLSPLWYASILRMKERSQPAFLKANLHRIKLPDQIAPEDFDMPLYMQPIINIPSWFSVLPQSLQGWFSGSGNSAAPSGHVLDKLEIKVLHNMMETYKNERLKQLKRSIQEAQNESRVLSREEVEITLRQNGLTMIADHLKETLKRGIENLYHYEAYERALEGGLSLDLLYLKFLFLGIPRSGKTSTRRRLVQEIINLRSLGQHSASTGVAETSDIIIKRLTSEYSAIANSNWQSITGPNDNKSSEHEKCGHHISHVARLMYQLIATTPLAQDQSAQEESEDKNKCIQTFDESSKDSVAVNTRYSDISNKDDTTSSKTPRNVQSVSVKQTIQPEIVTKTLEQTELDDAFTKLKSILQSDSPKELQQLLKELIMINMVDVGGQPALLEMLPALTNGPALYCLFFRLDQDLRKHYPVQYHDPHHKTEKVLKSSYCTEDTLCQALSSIACFSQSGLISSRILLFGTHKDKVDKGCISHIEDELKESLERTKIYTEGLLSKTAKGSLFFAVDNMDGSECEIMDIRTNIEGIIKTCFSATPIPASWLMFRIVLHLMNKPIVSLAQCEVIARRLSMPTSVKEALWFFHHKIGSIMYYPEIPSVQDTVICDPQIIFDSISILIIDRFVYSNWELKSVEVDEFLQNGLFTMAQIEDKTEQQRSACLSLQQLIDTLKHLNVLAEVKEKQENVEATHSPSTSPPKFIMPAVLKQASNEELSAPSEPGVNLGCPLMILFKGGFVPFGIFCASIAHLLAKHTQEWKLHKGKVMKNKVIFNVNQKYFITLISRLQYFEIRIHGHPQVCTQPKAVLLSVVNTIVETLQAVMSKMKYNQFHEASHFSIEQSFDLAFACCLGDSHRDHLMKVIEDKDGRYALCLKDKLKTTLNVEHRMWFNSEDMKGAESKIHPPTLEQQEILTIEDLREVQNTIWEARTQWYNIGLGLGLSLGSLEAIQCNNPKCEDCFRDMLSKWLKKANPRPTWSALAEALESPSVDYSLRLAESDKILLRKLQ